MCDKNTYRPTEYDPCHFDRDFEPSPLSNRKSYRITKYSVTVSHVSVPATADKDNLKMLLNKRIAEMERYTQVLKDELKMVEGI